MVAMDIISHRNSYGQISNNSISHLRQSPMIHPCLWNSIERSLSCIFEGEQYNKAHPTQHSIQVYSQKQL